MLTCHIHNFELKFEIDNSTEQQVNEIIRIIKLYSVEYVKGDMYLVIRGLKYELYEILFNLSRNYDITLI